MPRFIISIILLLSFINCYADNGTKGVKECFNKYKSAILEDRGRDAVKYLSRNTVEYYGDILQKTITYDSTAIEQLNLMDKLMVLMIRNSIPAVELLRMDGIALLERAISDGMVGKNGVVENQIGTVTANDNFAKAEIISKGKETGVFMHFYYEQGAWKFDVTSLFGLANIAFRKYIEDSGMPENEFIFNILSAMGKKPSADIWKPLT